MLLVLHLSFAAVCSSLNKQNVKVSPVLTWLWWWALGWVLEPSSFFVLCHWILYMWWLSWDLMVQLCECLGKHPGMSVHFTIGVGDCCGNSCGIKCLSQQRAVTWTACADAQRRGSGRPSGPWGSPSTGNSSTSTLPVRTTSSARVWASRLSCRDTVWQDRCWWAGNVVSWGFCNYFLLYTCQRSGDGPLSQASLILEILMLFISQEHRSNYFCHT